MLSHMKTTRRRDGFTLIELLIVVAVIGLLATIVGVAVNGARAKSRDNKRVSDLRQIQKGLELGFAQGSGYPAGTMTLGEPGTDVLCGKGGTIAFTADTSAANCDADKIYVGHIPTDPSPGGQYSYVSDGSTYCIQAALERDLPSLVLAAGAIRADELSLRNGSCP